MIKFNFKYLYRWFLIDKMRIHVDRNNIIIDSFGRVKEYRSIMNGWKKQESFLLKYLVN